MRSKTQSTKMNDEKFWWLCFYCKWDGVREYLRRKKKRKATIEKIRCCFHTVCSNNAPVDVLEAMIDIAGKDIVFEKDYELQTPLHDACASDRASIDTINLLIDTGGKKLLLMQDRHGWTALHSACRWIDNTEVIKLLIRRGGRELAKVQDKDGIVAKEIDDYVRWNHIIEGTIIISDYMDQASKKKLHQDDIILAKNILSSNPTVKDLNLIINKEGVPSNHTEMFQKYRDQKLKHEIFLHSIEWVLKSTNVSKEQRQLYSDYREKLREESAVSEPKRRRLLSSC